MLKKYIFISLLCFAQKFTASDSVSSTFFNPDKKFVNELSTSEEESSRFGNKKKSFRELLYGNNKQFEDLEDDDMLDEEDVMSPKIVRERYSQDFEQKLSTPTEPKKPSRLLPEDHQERLHNPEMLDDENMMGTDTDLKNQKQLQEKPNKKS